LPPDILPVSKFGTMKYSEATIPAGTKREKMNMKRLSSPKASIEDMIFQAVTNQIPDYTLGSDRIWDF